MKWNFFGMWLNSRIKYNPEKPPKGWGWFDTNKKWNVMTEEERQKSFDKYIRDQIIVDSVIFYLLCFVGILAVWNAWVLLT